VTAALSVCSHCLSLHQLEHTDCILQLKKDREFVFYADQLMQQLPSDLAVVVQKSVRQPLYNCHHCCSKQLVANFSRW
jgi:hypothetical protein